MTDQINIERIIPCAPAPEWWDRMWDKPTFTWCQADVPIVPDGFDRQWGCYRLHGHAGRHMGLVSTGSYSDKDAWVVWS